MRFKGNQPLHKTPPPDSDSDSDSDSDPDQQVRYPREVKPEDFSTVESIGERENRQADEANVEELERTSKDLWGRSVQQTDGAVPSEPPDTEPLDNENLDNPRRPPKHNI